MPQSTDFFGRTYSRAEIEHTLKAQKLITFSKPKDLIDVIAIRISKGSIIGWFEGASEFGPRALGHRSIFADPTNPLMKNKMNMDIKYRESFRPFAPVCIHEKIEKYFEFHFGSPFMTLTNIVKPEWRDRLPSITHIDGTSRLQSLKEFENPRLYHLLKSFEKVKGVPILLNTSLNLKGQPIAETPYDAIECFLSTKIDSLVIEDWLIEKINVADKQLVELYPHILDSTSIISEYRAKGHIFGVIGVNHSIKINDKQWNALQLINGKQKVREIIKQPIFKTLEWIEFLKVLEANDLIHFSDKT